MSDLISVLFGLAVVLAVIAVIGHGIWVGVAAVFRALLGDGPKPQKRGTHCPQCGASLSIVEDRCRICSFHLKQPASASLESDLKSTRRQLHRMFREGTISQERLTELLNFVRAEEERLGQQPLRKPSTEIPSVAVPSVPTTTPKVSEPVPKPETKPAEEALEIEDFIEKPPVPAVETPATIPVKPERRSFSDLLQVFMEEKNIRWGEIISGLLIVGSSIGLVVSLWSSLKEAIPYFPALVFMLVTAAIHGAGLYTLKKWNLQSTSRGLLMISMLLVPLNFLAAIALSEESAGTAQRAVTDPLYLIAVTVGMIGYGAISFSASRVLFGRQWWASFIAVMGPSVGQLVIARIAGPESTNRTIMLLDALPLLSFLIAVGSRIWFSSREKELSQEQVSQIFQLLGVAAFSFLMPIGLLVRNTESLRLTLAALSPCISLAAVGVLGIGLLIHRRVVAESLAATRTAGTSVALVGASLMLIALGSAWPQPDLFLIVGLADFLALTFLAILADLPVLHHAAVAALAISSVVGFHLWQGNLTPGSEQGGWKLAQVLLMGRSGIVLTVLSLVTAGCALLLKSLSGRISRMRAAAVSYLQSTAGVGAVALLIAVYAGFVPSAVDVELATPVFAVYAIAALATAGALRRIEITWLGTGLLLVSLLHAFHWNEFVNNYLTQHNLMPARPVVFAFLLHGTIAALISLWAFLRNTTNESNEDSVSAMWNYFGSPLGYSAMVTSLVVLPWIISVEQFRFAVQSSYVFWATGLWLLISWMFRSRVLFSAAQLLGTLGVGYAVTGVCREADWWSDSYLDPRHLQAQLGALAVWNIVWTTARFLFPSGFEVGLYRRRLADLITTPRPGVDRLILGAVVSGLVLLGCIGCIPGIETELDIPATSVELFSFNGLLILSIAIMTIGLFWTALQAVAGEARWVSAVVLLLSAGVILFWIFPRFPFEKTLELARLRHSPAYGMGGWIALGIAVLALLLSLRETFSSVTLCGLVFSGFVAALLFSGQMEQQIASASALRWSLSIFGVVTASLSASRKRIGTLAAKLGFSSFSNAHPAAAFRNVSLGLTLVPVLALTWGFVISAMSGTAAFRPVAESIFGRMGPAVSYTGPLILLATSCLVYAIREREPLFTFASSFLLQFGIGLCFLLPKWLESVPIGYAELVELLQWHALGFALFSLVWLTVRQWREKVSTADETPEIPGMRSPLGFQLALPVVILGGQVIGAFIYIFAIPGRLPAAIEQVGSPVGYASLVLTVIAWLAWLRPWRKTVALSTLSSEELSSFRQRNAVNAVVAFAMALVVFASCSTVGSNTAENWLTFHTLTGGCCILAMLTVLGVGLLTSRFSSHASLQSDSSGEEIRSQWGLENIIAPLVSRTVLIGVIVVLLAVRGVWQDPLRPWWSMGPVTVIALCATALSLLRRNQPFAYASVFLAMLSTTFVWIGPWIGIGDEVTVQSWADLAEANLIAAALGGLFWLAVEIYRQRRQHDLLDPLFKSPPVHHVTASAGLIVASVATVAILIVRSLNFENPDLVLPILNNPGGWLTFWAFGLLIACSLWDRTAVHAVGCLYGWGLLGLALMLDEPALAPRMLTFWSAAMAAGYVTAVGLLGTQRTRLARLAEDLTIPTETIDAGRIDRWLPITQCLLAALVTVVEVWVVLTFEDLTLRYWGTFSALLLVPGFVCMAQGSSKEWLRGVTLFLGVMVAVDLGWALMGVKGDSDYWLQRTIRLMEMLAVAAFLYGVVLVRLLPVKGRWFQPARLWAAVAGFAALLSLILVLGMEAAWFERGVGAPVTDPQIAVVSVVLVGLVVALISLAVLPGYDPLNLTERGRMVYVYTAEAVLSLLFLHIWLTKPMWFRGFLLPYWPYIVMAIAYFGAGVAEFFHRRQFRVLAEPLHRTGAFLPLLPAIGFWIHSSQAGPDVLFGEYSTLLFIVGLLYVFLSMWRKSFWYGLTAALAGNAGLWALWIEQGWSLFSQPQLWMIPPALSVIAAAQVNRDRLSNAQLTAIRYFCVTLIYVCSTGDMFIKGVGENIWMPMLLALFSVIGVFAGILLRVRAFLYLGSSFLMLSIISMVWHAQQRIGHTWPWWTFLIVLGLSILTLFGLFEKKRNEVLKVLNQLKSWEN